MSYSIRKAEENNEHFVNRVLHNLHNLGSNIDDLFGLTNEHSHHRRENSDVARINNLHSTSSQSGEVA